MRLLLLAGLASLLGLAQCQIPASFNHGVASGDPLYDSIILWTRVTPRTVNISTAKYNVTWTVYSGSNLTNVVQTGVVSTDVSRDFTVKVDVHGLRSQTQYAYRFRVGSVVSDVGSFRLPTPPGSRLDKLKFFVYSCSNWGFGYFNAYDVGSRYDLDFWVHLGDYFYEYGVTTYPGPDQAVRYEPAPLGLQPATEIQSIDDYRRRHALYRMDRGLQSLSASSPAIVLWDDHEFMNNVYENGAENQDPGELEFMQRKMNAAQAYHEWMPIRDTPSNFYAINRTLQFGDLATMFVLEDRVTARTNAGNDGPAGDPNNVPSASTVIARIVNNTAPANWGTNITDQILAYKNLVDTRRTGANETMMSVAQEAVIARETNAASSPGANRTVWQQYLGGLVMLDLLSPDFEGAIAVARARGDTARADLWQQALNNLTSGTPGATYTSYSPTPYLAANYSKSYPVSPASVAAYRALVAIGRYKVVNNLDQWTGYIADRNRFLNAIANATNPVVYGGDTHNFWGGYIYNVDPQGYFGLNKTTPIRPGQAPAAVEFDTTSVTSNGWEASAILPIDLINEGHKAASPGLLIADVQYKGGLYVELTPTNQHVEYVYVNTIATEDYTAFCGMAYDVPARTNISTPLKINPGQCSPVPNARPYQKSLILSEEARIVPGNVTLPSAGAPTSAVQAAG
jgi:phosphodiesterase/alkaline phosphatase D-like protein